MCSMKFYGTISFLCQMICIFFVIQANKKFNQGLAENSKLREEIDHMRTERTIFQGLYKKLEKV